MQTNGRGLAQRRLQASKFFGALACFAFCAVASNAFADNAPSAKKTLGSHDVFAIEGQTSSPFYLGMSTPFVGLETFNSTSHDSSSGADITTNTSSLCFDARLHFFVIDRLSIGVEFAFAHDLSSTQDAHSGTGTTHTDLPQSTLWGVLPMIGYQVPLAKYFSLWPKAGIGVRHQSTSPTSSGTITSETIDWYFADADISLVFEPIEHFALALGSGASMHLTGRRQTTDISLVSETYDYHEYQFRWLTAHFIAWW